MTTPIDRTPTDDVPPAAAGRRAGWDRQLLAVFLLAVAVFVARGVWVAKTQDPGWDAPYHVNIGVAWWTDDLARRQVQDPPLGGALVVIPLILLGCYDASPGAFNWLDGHRVPADQLWTILAVWKSVLLAPLVPLFFAWARRLYGPRAGWLCAACLLVDPNLAAFVPLIANDATAVPAIFACCVLAWRYFERPTTGRLVAMAAAAPVAMMLKSTGIVVPAVLGVYLVLWWVVKPYVGRQPMAQWRAALPGRARAVGLAILVAAASLWAVTRFDVSPPLRGGAARDWGNGPVARVLRTPMPAGVYVRSAAGSALLSRAGKLSSLFGELRMNGWWYYFPVTLVTKVPVGLLLVLALGVASLAVRRPRFDEWSVLVPTALYWVMLLTTTINIGVRHMLPALALMYLLASRAAAGPTEPAGDLAAPADPAAPRRPRAMWARRPARAWLAWAGVGVAAAHVATYGPDFVAYFNLPYRRPYAIFSDGSIYFRQADKQVRTWAARDVSGRRVYFCRETLEPLPPAVPGDPVTVVNGLDLPTRGLFAVAPCALYGIGDPADPLAPLRSHDPVALVGHSVPVYDLDAISGGRGFDWPTKRDPNPAAGDVRPPPPP